MDATLLIAALVVISLLYWILQTNSGKPTLPGPTGLPVIGYIPFLTSKPYIKFDELQKKYGPVYSLKIGSKYVLMLCDFPSIKDAFSRDAFMGRPLELPFELHKETIETEAFTGLPWKEQRRFSLHMLRDLGFGKTRMETHIKEEINELIDRLAEHKGKPTQISTLLAPSTSNNIASLMFGRRLKYDDPKRIKLDKLLSNVGLLAGQVSWQLFFPQIRALMKRFHIGKQKILSQSLQEIADYIQIEIDEHERTFDQNNVRDLIDCYLIEIEKRKNDPNTTFQRPMLVDLVRAFFGAGSETVRVTVDWLMLTMAAYPEVQNKVYAEICDTIGCDRFPTRADFMNMPYTEATTLELMRWQTIIPINILRCTLMDTELNGYFIPKGTLVMANFWSIMHDSKLWGADEDKFRPERFLSEDGKSILKIEHFIPFSIGKRACPGEQFAKVEVFLYFVALLQKFRVSLPPGKSADFDAILGIGLQPKRQDICMELRK